MKPQDDIYSHTLQIMLAKRFEVNKQFEFLFQVLISLVIVVNNYTKAGWHRAVWAYLLGCLQLYLTCRRVCQSPKLTCVGNILLMTNYILFNEQNGASTHTQKILVIEKLKLTFHSYVPTAIPLAAPVPAKPMKWPLPILLENNEAPICPIMKLHYIQPQEVKCSTTTFQTFWLLNIM